jgi:hypothetical protein
MLGQFKREIEMVFDTSQENYIYLYVFINICGVVSYKKGYKVCAYYEYGRRININFEVGMGLLAAINMICGIKY